jgi:DNA-binding transcriptional regulator YdaS (Cro superfamily)
MKYEPPLQLVFERLGGPTAVSKIAGVVPSAVTQWRRVPLRHVHKLSEAAKLTYHEIRPDMYPPSRTDSAA